MLVGLFSFKRKILKMSIITKNLLIYLLDSGIIFVHKF
nr:MAG TPA: hypothetical protein [Caudoviricetes sp.]